MSFNFIFLHIFYGLIAVIKDYVHTEELVIFLNFLIRVLLLNLTLLIIEYTF